MLKFFKSFFGKKAEPVTEAPYKVEPPAATTSTTSVVNSHSDIQEVKPAKAKKAPAKKKPAAPKKPRAKKAAD